MNIIKILLLMMVIFSSPQLYASDEDIDGWPPESAMGVGLQVEKNTEKLEKALDIKMKELIDLAAKTNYIGIEKDIEELQTNWKKYIKSECRMILYTSTAGGSWPSTQSLTCESNLLTQRITAVNKTINCFKKKSIDNVVSRECYTCFFNLMPFNLK